MFRVRYVAAIQREREQMLLTRLEHLEEAERFLLKAHQAHEDRNVPYTKIQIMLEFAKVYAILATADIE